MQWSRPRIDSGYVAKKKKKKKKKENRRNMYSKCLFEIKSEELVFPYLINEYG
jgi:hypothetical protein